MSGTWTSVSAIVATEPDRFSAHVDAQWSIAGKPNGGYLLGMLARAVTSVGPHPHVLAASAHYLRSPDFGPVELQATLLRAGRNASQLRGQLLQDGKVCVEATFTTGTLAENTKPYWDAGLPSSAGASFEEAIRLPSTSPTGLPVPIMGEVDLRLDPSVLGFAAGTPSGDGELSGWLALPEGEPFDHASLLYAVDAFPPATFNVELTGWVPTLELTAYIRALPAPGPVRILHRAQLVAGQRVDEITYVWDSTGQLVAQATQLAGIKLG